MPDRDVKTIRDQIFYQYAKIIVHRVISPSKSSIINHKLLDIDDDGELTVLDIDQIIR
jgi:hypothetical protein